MGPPSSLILAPMPCVSDAVKIESQLMKLVPQENWIAFSHCLVWHGRRRCDARKPDCAGCEIANVCPKVGVKE